jgi:hypothetical protein
MVCHHIRLKCIQTLKVRVRIMYAELLDPSPGGPVGVDEGHVRHRRAIVPRNVREPNKEVSLPRRGDVDQPHRLPSTRQSSQHRDVLQTQSHLADREWNVCISGRHRSMNAAISGAS